MARNWPRRAGALALAVVTVLALRLAHAGWAPALLAGAAAALFVAWRTVPGVCAGLAVFCGAAALSWLDRDAGSLGSLSAALPSALALELFGLLTILAVAGASEAVPTADGPVTPQTTLLAFSRDEGL
jgi:hypothetical protein